MTSGRPNGNGTLPFFQVGAVAAVVVGLWLNLDQSIDAKARWSENQIGQMRADLERHREDGHVVSREQFAEIRAWVQDLRERIKDLDDKLQREIRANGDITLAQVEGLDDRLQREMRDLDTTLDVRAVHVRELHDSLSHVVEKIEERVRTLEVGGRP